MCRRRLRPSFTGRVKRARERAKPGHGPTPRTCAASFGTRRVIPCSAKGGWARAGFPGGRGRRLPETEGVEWWTQFCERTIGLTPEPLDESELATDAPWK